MRYFLSLLLAVFSLLPGYSQQENYIKHKVVKSETVTQIARKYNVTLSDIYKLNPDAKKSIKEDDILLIPPSGSTPPKSATPTAAPVVGVKPKTYLVAPGETLFSIARKYSVSVDAIKNANPEALKNGLKSGQTIHIPGGTQETSPGQTVSETPKPVSKPAETKPAEPKPIVVKPAESKPVAKAAGSKAPVPNLHIVQQGETKFSIAKMYGITVKELEKQNPAIASGLATGTELKIISETRPSTPNDPIVEKPKPNVVQISTGGTIESEKVVTTTRAGFANYEVKPKETLFSLAKSFNITEDQLVALNPKLKDGVKTGMILKVPGKGSIVAETSAGYSDLSKSIKQGGTRKELVLLLPFNASKIQADSTNGVGARLKKDAFLNLTLDFYSGALMAIDSAKTLGLNVDVRILDSEESKSGSNIANLLKDSSIKTASAVIGPFYQQYAEKVAEELNKTNIAVISPLSKESGKSFPNLFQAMPSEQFTRKAMLDYLVSKNGNIIVVADPKRVANRDFITANYKGIQFADLDAAGNVLPDNLRAKLAKDRTNYVILDTEKTGMILGTTNLLLNEVQNFQIQLAIIEQNETLDFEEVSMKRLTILKLVYPSMTRDNASDAAQQFRNAYKTKNRIFPNQYATRGFDITFDTLLRLSQGKTFAESASEKTEQVESKFDYEKQNEGYVNKGIYIMQYNDDLSVQEAQ
jgi:LysM repeat protein